MINEITKFSLVNYLLDDGHERELRELEDRYKGRLQKPAEESVINTRPFLTEISKLPKEYFSKIDSAIKNSAFWTKSNDRDSIDIGPKGSMQSPAAGALEDSLQNVFDELGLPIDSFVSTSDEDDELYHLNPGHPAYPDKWLIDARWYVSKKHPNRNTIDLQIMPLGENADIDDVNPSVLIRHIAQSVRHELVHYTQMKKQSVKKGMYNDVEAFRDMLRDPKQVPKEDSPKYWEIYEPTGNKNEAGDEEFRKEGFDQVLYTQDYLKSHIEIDAHAHDAAEELLAVYGLKGSKDLLSRKVDMSDPKLPNAIQHYLEYLPHGSKTVKLLKKKMVAYLDHFAE